MILILFSLRLFYSILTPCVILAHNNNDNDNNNSFFSSTFPLTAGCQDGGCTQLSTAKNLL